MFTDAFLSGGEKAMGFEGATVRGVLGREWMIELAAASGLVCGIVHFDGKVLPVIDLQGSVDRSRAPVPVRNCVVLVEVVVNGAPRVFGVLADAQPGPVGTPKRVADSGAGLTPDGEVADVTPGPCGGRRGRVCMLPRTEWRRRAPARQLWPPFGLL